MIVFHIAEPEDWNRRDSHYSPASLAADGFVHCSEPEQVVTVADRLFAGRTDLVILEIDTEALDVPVYWEDSYGVGEEFPHVYGPVPLTAISQAEPFPPGTDGSFGWWDHSNGSSAERV